MKRKTKKAVSAAGRVLRDKESSPDERSAAASALAKSDDATISPMKDLLAHVKAFIEAGDLTTDEARAWQITFSNDLGRMK